MTCWPNGKASDYGALLLILLPNTCTRVKEFILLSHLTIAVWVCIILVGDVTCFV